MPRIGDLEKHQEGLKTTFGGLDKVGGLEKPKAGRNVQIWFIDLERCKKPNVQTTKAVFLVVRAFWFVVGAARN